MTDPITPISDGDREWVGFNFTCSSCGRDVTRKALSGPPPTICWSCQEKAPTRTGDLTALQLNNDAMHAQAERAQESEDALVECRARLAAAEASHAKERLRADVCDSQITDLIQEKMAAEGRLAECFRLTGGDPDGNEDWRLASDAVAEVRRLRKESDDNGDRADKAEKQRDAAEAERDRLLTKQQDNLLTLTLQRDAAEAALARILTEQTSLGEAAEAWQLRDIARAVLGARGGEQS